MKTEHRYKGFVARDEDESLHLFFSEPDKRESEVGQGEWSNDTWDGFPLNNDDFRDVKWEDEKAQRVVVVIKKEIDLEKEIQQHINDCLNIKFPTTDINMIAKDVEHTARKFFELGLKAQKGE